MISRRLLLIASASELVWSNALATTRRGQPAPIPPGYVAMGRMNEVPPAILYGVALQESKMLFGEKALPYPWTLNVEKVPMRFKSYEASVAALRGYVSRGVNSVDCGLLQVNWGYHHDKLKTFWTAMDPYPNIGVGARLLRSHFVVTRNWFDAVARYHNANPTIGVPYAKSVYRHIAEIPVSPVALGGFRG